MQRARRHSAKERRALDAALGWVRGVGGAVDRLPRGFRDSATQCPLAEASGWLVAGGSAAPPGDGPLRWYALPDDVALFVELFDKGRYPELELR